MKITKRTIKTTDREIKTEGFTWYGTKTENTKYEWDEFVANLATHIMKAETKHPVFTTEVSPKFCKLHSKLMIKKMRQELKKKVDERRWSFFDLVNCELLEIIEKLTYGDMDGAMEELFDTIAVLYRQYAVMRKIRLEKHLNRKREKR